MDAVFKKLNYKDHQQVFALHTPDSFETNLQSVAGTAKIFKKIGDDDTIEFAIAFAVKQSDVDNIAHTIGPKLKGDAVFWIGYPKGTSKKYKCDFNRDTGWQVLGQFDLEPVRQVAIDEDWSALRFRKVQYIKTMIRSEKMVLSEAGKDKLNK